MLAVDDLNWVKTTSVRFPIGAFQHRSAEQGLKVFSGPVSTVMRSEGSIDIPSLKAVGPTKLATMAVGNHPGLRNLGKRSCCLVFKRAQGDPALINRVISEDPLLVVAALYP